MFSAINEQIFYHNDRMVRINKYLLTITIYDPELMCNRIFKVIYLINPTCPSGVKENQYQNNTNTKIISGPIAQTVHQLII